MSPEEATQLGATLAAGAFALYSTVQSLIAKSKTEVTHNRLDSGNTAFAELREAVSSIREELATVRVRLSSIETKQEPPK